MRKSDFIRSVAVSLAIVANASASLIVDDYTYAELGGEYSSPELCGYGVPESAGSRILGGTGTRTIAISRTSVAGGCLYAAINQGGITGDLSIAGDPDASGTLSIIGRGQQTVIPADATHVTVRAFSDTSAWVQIFLYNSSVGYVGGVPVTVFADQYTDYDLSLVDFVGILPGITTIEGYLLVVQASQGGSLFIDEILVRATANGPVSNVPEASTGLVVAVGLFALSAMRRRRRASAALGVFMLSSTLGVSTCSAITMPPAPSGRVDNVRFEPNLGHAAGQVLGRAGGGLSLFGDDGVYFAVPQHRSSEGAVAISIFKMEFGSSAELLLWQADEIRRSRSKYFLGKKTFDVPQYGSIRSTVSPGIDVHFYGHKGALKYDLVLAAGEDPAALSLRFPSANVSIVAGSLHVSDRHTTMIHSPPVAYQTCGGQDRPVSVQYALEGDSVGFRLGAYDPSCRVVIDPVVHFGLSGGSGVDEAHDLVAVGGILYVAGSTLSPNIPLTVGTATVVGAALLETFDSNGTLRAATVVGGTDAGSSASGIFVDAAGRISIVGWTAASDYPSLAVPSEFQKPKATPSVEAFVTVFSDISTPVMSACFGGSGRDAAEAVAGRGKAIYVAGSTNSPEFPTKQPSQPALAGGHDAFILVLEDGKLAASTFVGGSGNEGARAVAVGDGAVVIGGLTYSSDLPITAPAIDSALSGLGYADGFVVRYTIQASGLVPDWMSYFGGDAQDVVTALALGPTGDIYIGGTTFSVNLPLKNAWRVRPAASDGFAARISSAGTLMYSTYVGGNDLDEITRIGLDSNGSLVLAGSTRSTFAADPTLRQGQATDVLIGAINPDGSLRKLVSTGGNGDDYGMALAVVNTRLWIAGASTSTDIPLVNSALANAGLADAFLLGVDLEEPLLVPIISSPASRAQLLSSVVRLAWGGVPNATGYDVELDDGVQKRSTWVAAPSSSLNVSARPGSHTARVRACLDSARAACSPAAAVSFDVVVTTQPQVPIFITPLSGSSFRSTVTFSWTPVSGAAEYELEVRDQAADERVLRIRVREAYTIYTIRSGAYRATVRACSPDCGASSSTDFQVGLTVPLTAPTGLTCSATGADLSCTWSAVPGADLYVAHVVHPGAGPGGGALSVAAKQVGLPSLTTPVPPGRASIVVQACTGDGCSPSSTAIEIEVVGGNVAVPILGTPVAGQTIDSGVNPPTVLFSWNRVAGDNGSNYRYRLFVQDFSTQEPALDVHTGANYHAAYFNAGSRFDAIVIATPLAGGPSIAGPPQGFATRGKRNPNAPTAVAPAHGEKIASGPVRLQWTKLASESRMFQYFVGRNDGVFVTGTSQTNSATVDLRPGQYTLAIRMCLTATCPASSDVGWGAWSGRVEGGTSTFTVQ